mmetsp:Transcript_45320/g.73981  ORF Transcript_45320/g.73981 Transcript_45320/m.73981 type:complete len:99 (+) Transcript_45320:214-510(+)
MCYMLKTPKPPKKEQCNYNPTQYCYNWISGGREVVVQYCSAFMLRFTRHGIGHLPYRAVPKQPLWNSPSPPTPKNVMCAVIPLHPKSTGVHWNNAISA